MRVRIIFNLRNRGASLPFHHQNILSDFIKDILLTGDKKDYTSFDFYNFSGLKGQTKISKKGLDYLSNKTTLVLSSPNEDFIKYFLNLLFKLPQVELGELVLNPSHVEKEEVQRFTEEVKYVCISPIVVVNPLNADVEEAKNFITPESDLFSDLLYESTMERMERIKAYSADQIASFFKFQIVPDKVYLNKIKQEEKKFARIYSIGRHDQRYEARGYTFPFTLYAAPEVQLFLFNCGLGVFTNSGFGMIDLTNSANARKTEVYNF